MCPWRPSCRLSTRHMTSEEKTTCQRRHLDNLMLCYAGKSDSGVAARNAKAKPRSFAEKVEIAKSTELNGPPVRHREGITGPHCQDCNLGDHTRPKEWAAADRAGCVGDETLSARIMLQGSGSLRFRFI